MVMKRLLALCASFAMTLSAVIPQTVSAADPAAPAAGTETQMDASGTGAVGKVLGDTLSDAMAAETGTVENRICSVVMDGSSAEITYNISQNCTAVVGIYSEDGGTLLATGRAELDMDAADAEIPIDCGTVPEYYLLQAYLIDSYSLRPLTEVYESGLYTEEMQSFLQKTTADFDADRVVNLDDSDWTNYVVLSESVVRLPEDAGTLTQQDSDAMTYTFADAGAALTGLKAGDIFAYEAPEHELVIVKIASMKQDGSDVTVQGAPLETEDVFDYVRLDAGSDMDGATVDTSEMDPEVQLAKPAQGAPSDNITLSKALKVTIGSDLTEEHSEGGTDEDQEDKVFSVEVSGNLTIQASVTVEYYLALKRQYLRVQFDYGASFDVTIEGKIEKSFKLGRIAYPVIPGVLDVGITVNFRVEFSAGIEFADTISGTFGFSLEHKGLGKVHVNDLTKKPERQSTIKFKGGAFVGFEFEPGIEIVSGLGEVELTAKIGVQAETEQVLYDSTWNDETRHECDSCVEGKVSFVGVLTGEIGLLEDQLGDLLSLEEEIAKIESQIGEFHYSDTFKEFSWSKCKHYAYRALVKVVDEDGVAVNGAKVSDQTKTYTTDAKGYAKIYVHAGRLVLTASKDNYADTRKEITVSEPTEVTIQMRRTKSDKKDGRIKSPKTLYTDADGKIITPDKNGTIVSGGHKYRIYNQSCTWDEAKAFCEKAGGHLATVTSQQEENVIEALLFAGTRNSYWLGGKIAYRQLTWITGEETGYTNWASMQPDNYHGEDSLMIYCRDNPIPAADTSYQWNDLRSDGTCMGEAFFGVENFGFICEWENAAEKPAAMRPVMFAPDAEAEPAEEPDPAETDCSFSEQFTGLLADSVYNLYVMETAQVEDPFGDGNLLGIWQLISDENGTVDVSRELLAAFEDPDVLLVGMDRIDLSEAEVTVADMPFIDGGQIPQVTVTLGGKTLTEGLDYLLKGDFMTDDCGEFTVRIEGDGCYAGTADGRFSVTLTPGDVNLDGADSVSDAVLLTRYISEDETSSLKERGAEAADFDQDGVLTILDVTKLLALLTDEA